MHKSLNLASHQIGISQSYLVLYFFFDKICRLYSCLNLNWVHFEKRQISWSNQICDCKENVFVKFCWNLVTFYWQGIKISCSISASHTFSFFDNTVLFLFTCYSALQKFYIFHHLLWNNRENFMTRTSV